MAGFAGQRVEPHIELCDLCVLCVKTVSFVLRKL